MFSIFSPTDISASGLSAERLRMKLYSLGVPHECDLETTAEGGKNYSERVAHAAIEFIHQALERERLRIV